MQRPVFNFRRFDEVCLRTNAALKGEPPWDQRGKMSLRLGLILLVVFGGALLILSALFVPILAIQSTAAAWLKLIALLYSAIIFGLLSRAQTLVRRKNLRQSILKSFADVRKQLRESTFVEMVGRNLGPGDDPHQRALTSFMKLAQAGEMDKAEKMADQAALEKVAIQHGLSKLEVQLIIADGGIQK